MSDETQVTTSMWHVCYARNYEGDSIESGVHSFLEHEEQKAFQQAAKLEHLGADVFVFFGSMHTSSEPQWTKARKDFYDELTRRDNERAQREKAEREKEKSRELQKNLSKIKPGDVFPGEIFADPREGTTGSLHGFWQFLRLEGDEAIFLPCLSTELTTEGVVHHFDADNALKLPAKQLLRKKPIFNGSLWDPRPKK
jgi:hypothetical protein